MDTLEQRVKELETIIEQLLKREKGQTHFARPGYCPYCFEKMEIREPEKGTVEREIIELEAKYGAITNVYFCTNPSCEFHDRYGPYGKLVTCKPEIDPYSLENETLDNFVQNLTVWETSVEYTDYIKGIPGDWTKYFNSRSSE